MGGKLGAEEAGWIEVGDNFIAAAVSLALFLISLMAPPCSVPAFKQILLLKKREREWVGRVGEKKRKERKRGEIQRKERSEKCSVPAFPWLQEEGRGNALQLSVRSYHGD